MPLAALLLAQALSPRERLAQLAQDDGIEIQVVRTTLRATRYGIGGGWMQTKGVGDLRADLPGFVTAYSTSAVEEDKAELFSHLLCDPAFVAARLRARISTCWRSQARLNQAVASHRTLNSFSCASTVWVSLP